MAGSVDQVYLKDLPCVMPESRGGSRGDSDTPLLLLDHPVHRGGAIVHFPDLVSLPRVEQDTLRGRGLAGIDVRHDADVAGKM